ncbi:MAG TPA: molybdenum cofactor guanylyltransferase [Xanthomonadales bacterium]|nr:molybdenum cofactor guanylyltransferase [Xanthomonadales bacterium]
MRDDVSALILAGGKATRLGGVDKRELVIEGRTIFERQVALLREAVAEIVVSSPKDIAGFRTVRDAIVDGGPLAGIAAGLAGARTPWVLVLAGDMPYLTRDVIERLLARTAADIDAVGIRIAGLPEPLVCVLSVSACLPIVQARLARGDLKASRLLTAGDLRVAWLDETDARAFGSVNVPADL